MNAKDWLLFAVFVMGIVSLIGFFVTKTDGFGRFTTSTFLILLVIIISGLFYAAERLDSLVFANILFAVIGFAGGLFTGKECKENSAPTKGTSNAD